MTEPRLRRSELSTPGSNERMIARAAASDADLVFLDLEDAVAPGLKAAARGAVAAALRDLDWGGKTRAVRVNGLDTEWGYEDLVEVVRVAGAALDVVIVPKVRGRDDVVWVDRLLTALERGMRRDRPIGLEVLIEEAEALAAVEAIAAASPRLEALILGSGDLAASQGIRHTRMGAFRGDVFGYARQRVVVAARAAGIDAVDGPYWGPVDDGDGYRAECEQAAILGFAGKWAIHPAQIPLANDAFRPTAAEVDEARRTRERYTAAMAAGRGAVAVDGVMIDMVDLRLADAVLAQADRLERSRRR